MNDIKKASKKEENILISIGVMKKIMTIFMGPFFTAYFVKKSAESLKDLGFYYILTFVFMAASTYLTAKTVKNKYRLHVLRIGVVFSFLYIFSIILLNEKTVEYLWLVALLHGIGSGTYWFSFSLFSVNKIKNSRRTDYTVKNSIISSIVGILCPFLLGLFITGTNFEITSLAILLISALMIVLSFLLTPEEQSGSPPFDFLSAWKKLKRSDQVRKTLAVDFLTGVGINEGALGVLITVIIFNSFKTDMNLGIITSVTTVISMICTFIYGKVYKKRDEKKLMIFSSAVPVLSVFVLLAWRANITVVLYNVLFTVLTGLLQIMRGIRTENILKSYIVTPDIQPEFYTMKDIAVNAGRIVGYFLLMLAGLSGSQLILNLTLIVLTLSILPLGLIMKGIGRFDSDM